MGRASLRAGAFWHLPKAAGTFWRVLALSACSRPVVAVRCWLRVVPCHPAACCGGAALRGRRGLPTPGSLLRTERSDSGVAVAVADSSQKVFPHSPRDSAFLWPSPPGSDPISDDSWSRLFLLPLHEYFSVSLSLFCSVFG